MAKKSGKNYKPKKKNNEFGEFVKRNGLYLREAQEYKNDAGFRELCELLEGTRTEINDNLFALRLKYLRNPNENERILEKFIDAYKSQMDGLNRYGLSNPFPYIDRGLKACNLIDSSGRLTEKGYQFVNTLSLKA